MTIEKRTEMALVVETEAVRNLLNGKRGRGQEGFGLTKNGYIYVPIGR